MVIVDCIVLHYMHIWHLTIWASSLQFRASKINMALARMDKLVKKLMSNPGGREILKSTGSVKSDNQKKLNEVFPPMVE